MLTLVTEGTNSLCGHLFRSIEITRSRTARKIRRFETITRPAKGFDSRNSRLVTCYYNLGETTDALTSKLIAENRDRNLCRIRR